MLRGHTYTKLSQRHPFISESGHHTSLGPTHLSTQISSNEIKTSCLLSGPIPGWVREFTSQAEIIKSRRRPIRHKWKGSCHTNLAFHRVCQISWFEREAPEKKTSDSFIENTIRMYSFLRIIVQKRKPFSIT